MFTFAYDGSINGDWVSHYAIQLAAAHHEQTLTLLHVRDSSIPQARIVDALQRMRTECEYQQVQLVERLVPSTGCTFEAIRAATPEGPAHFLVCGARGRDDRRGSLIGDTSRRLLGAGHCNILAVRVVQPGLLGAPRRLLLPVAQRPDGARQALPFLRLFGPQVTHLHIILVTRVGPRRFRRMSHELKESLRGVGQAYCERLEEEIIAQLGLRAAVRDAQVVVSDEIHREILIAANRTKSRLIYMGASERHASERLMHGDPIEQVLRAATCDVAIYRGLV